MRTLSEINQVLAAIEDELQQLNSRRTELLSQVAGLKQERAAVLEAQAVEDSSALPAAVTNRSAQEAKVALFRSLFRGREDVYARRFESLKTGKKGYQPVCRNEWISGVCEKPKTRCDDCRFREYLARHRRCGAKPSPGVGSSGSAWPRLHDGRLSHAARRNLLVPGRRLR